MFYVFYDVFEAVMNGLSSLLGVWGVVLLCIAGLAIGLLANRRNRGGDRA